MDPPASSDLVKKILKKTRRNTQIGYLLYYNLGPPTNYIFYEKQF